MEKFKVGDIVRCKSNALLKGNELAPNLIVGMEYEIQEIVYDKEKNQHLDVGLKSSLNWVSSYETGEHLPNGDEIHWCHPSRFELL